MSQLEQRVLAHVEEYESWENRKYQMDPTPPKTVCGGEPMALGEIIEGRHCRWAVYNYDDAAEVIDGLRAQRAGSPPVCRACMQTIALAFSGA